MSGNCLIKKKKLLKHLHVLILKLSIWNVENFCQQLVITKPEGYSTRFDEFSPLQGRMANKRVAIIGAGPAGLMAAEVLSQYAMRLYTSKSLQRRKFLMAGKTGLNISHAEPLAQFIERYDHAEWLKPWVEKWDAFWIQSWMKSLGIESYVGTSGRIFPVEMKAALCYVLG